VVVSQFHLMRVAVVPSKANAPLSIDPNAELPSTISFQILQSVVRGNPQLRRSLGVVDHSEFSSCGVLHINWQRPNGVSLPDLFCGFRTKRPCSAEARRANCPGAASRTRNETLGRVPCNAVVPCVATCAARTPGTASSHRHIPRGRNQLHTIFERHFDEPGAFVSIPFSGLQAMTEIFRRRVTWLLVEKQLLLEDFARNLLSWKNSGISIDNSVRVTDAKTQESLASTSHALRSR